MSHHNHHYSTVLALDVGEKRIGVALASLQARLAHPLKTLHRSKDSFEQIQALVDEHGARTVVVGLPRGLSGQTTAQTRSVEEFKAELQRVLTVPAHWQDEAVTSAQAEEELRSRGKPYKKEDIDALAATYILEDYLRGAKL
jgi:putative Holliday junction resolvase